MWTKNNDRWDPDDEGKEKMNGFTIRFAIYCDIAAASINQNTIKYSCGFINAWGYIRGIDNKTVSS